MDPDKVEAVAQWKAPRNKKDVQKFIGFCNFYRKFIPNFSRMTAPITDCLRGKKPFKWTEGAQKAFEELKRLFTSEEQLLHVNPEKPMRVETDASDRAVGAVLLQQDQQGDWRPCAFFSRKLLPAEENYTIWDKELLAIFAAFKKWRHFLIGARHQIQVCTDHKNLEYWRTARILNQRQIRWAEFFADFNFKIEYIPGGQNGRADALSRKPEYMAEERPKVAREMFRQEQWASAARVVLPEAVKPLIKDDPYAHKLVEAITRGEGKEQGLELREGLIYRKGAMYIPPGEVRKKILRQVHDQPTAGHFGKHKTMELVMRDFWWPKIREEVEEYVRTCDQCQRMKVERRSPAGLLQPLSTPEKPWEVVSIDFITDLPESRRKNAVLVVVDIFSKMAHFIPCNKEISAEATAKLFVEHVFRLHGMPEKIVSDRGSVFTSRFWKRLMELLQVEVSLSSARHPQTNGQAERANEVLQQYLRCYVNERQNDWIDYLPLAEFAYNNAMNSSTGMAPFIANYGLQPRAFPGATKEWSVPAAEELAEEMESLHRMLRNKVEEAKEAYKKYADKHRREGDIIKVGDWVWLSSEGLPYRGRCKKFAPRKLGPFQVEQQINEVAFKLRLPENMRIHPVFHRALLSRWHGREGEEPSSRERDSDFESGEERGDDIFEIVDSRWHHGELQYLVSWENGSPEDQTWVNADEVGQENLIVEFHELFPDKPRRDRWDPDELFAETDPDEEDFFGFPPFSSQGEEYRDDRPEQARRSWPDPSGIWHKVFETTDEEEEFWGFPTTYQSRAADEEAGMEVGEGPGVQELAAEEDFNAPTPRGETFGEGMDVRGESSSEVINSRSGLDSPGGGAEQGMEEEVSGLGQHREPQQADVSPQGAVNGSSPESGEEVLPAPKEIGKRQQKRKWGRGSSFCFWKKRSRKRSDRESSDTE